MYYSSTKYESLLDWVSSIGGIITIALIILAIWFIYNYFKKKNDDDEENDRGRTITYYPQENKTVYDDQSISDLEEDSFWDDVNKTASQQGTNIYPTREEEPVPPNAIPPSPYVEENFYEEMKVEGFENEGCFNSIIKDEISMDEPVMNEKKEDK